MSGRLAQGLAYALIVLVVVFGIAAAGWRHGVDSTNAKWQSRWDSEHARLSDERELAIGAARAEEQRRHAAASGQGEIARETTRQIDIDAADRTADGRLRDDAARIALRASECPADTAAAERSVSARRAAMVLTDLLERSVATNRELAEAYDRVRNAALTCNRTVDAWRRTP